MRNLLLAAAIVLATSTSYADRARYSRKPNLAIEVKVSKRVKPVEPAATPKPQPHVSADDLMLVMEHNEVLRRDQEAILVRLVSDTPDSDPDKPDYMFRLAEHYAQQLRFWRLKAIAPTIPVRPR